MLQVDGLRSTRGHLLVCVTTQPRAFPDCIGDAHATHTSIAATAAASTRLRLPGAGSYAFAVLHDENDNGRMDKLMGLPREGFGFSRNPVIRLGPPRFAQSAFAVASSGDVVERVTMKYLL